MVTIWEVEACLVHCFDGCYGWRLAAENSLAFIEVVEQSSELDISFHAAYISLHVLLNISNHLIVETVDIKV
jgi:hypothetical protein